MQIPSKHADQYDVEEILRGRETALVRLYETHRNAFVAWASRYFKYSEADLIVAYKEAVVVFYENVVNHKLTVMTSSTKTYLFSTAYRILANQTRQMTYQIVSLDGIESDALAEPKNALTDWLEREHKTEQTAKMRQALSQLGAACRTLLEHFYYEGYSISEIRVLLHYKNDQTVHSQKTRCLRDLRTYFQKQ